MKLAKTFIVLCLLCLLGADTGFAKVPLFTDLNNLVVRICQVVLVGQVKEIRGNQAEIEVQRVIKGEFKDKSIVVDCDNNADGWVEDPVQYNQGERVLFCFKDYGDGVLIPFKYPGIIHISETDMVTIWDFPKPAVDENGGWNVGGDTPLYKQTISLEECIKRMEQYMRKGEVDEKK